jgi:prevent-host-death family protein
LRSRFVYFNIAPSIDGTIICKRGKSMESFAIKDLREHTGELVRNAENGQCSVISKHGKPLFVALPFDDAMPYARYLQHLGSIGYSMLETRLS